MVAHPMRDSVAFSDRELQAAPRARMRGETATSIASHFPSGENRGGSLSPSTYAALLVVVEREVCGRLVEEDEPAAQDEELGDRFGLRDRHRRREELEELARADLDEKEARAALPHARPDAAGRSEVARGGLRRRRAGARREVLRETVAALDTEDKRPRVYAVAQGNPARWRSEAQAEMARGSRSVGRRAQILAAVARRRSSTGSLATLGRLTFVASGRDAFGNEWESLRACQSGSHRFRIR
jgi:hypothetical protein